MALDGQTSFSPISHNDHAGIVWILSLLSGVYTVLTLFVRWLQKRNSLGADDWTFFAATITACGSLATTYIALSFGLGKSNDLVSGDDLRTASRSIFAGRILFALSLAISKCSITLLIRRLFPKDMVTRRRICLYGLIIFVPLGLASALGLSIDCNSEHLLDDPKGQCHGQMARWSAVMGAEILTEVAIVIMSFFLVWGLRVRRDIKLKVIATFAFRLVPVITSILIIVYISNYVNSRNPNLAIVSSISTQSVHIFLHILTATVPKLRSFLVSFNTSLMMTLSGRQLEETQESEKHSDNGGGFFNRRGQSSKGPYGLSSLNNSVPPEPVNVRGQTRAYNRGARGAQREGAQQDSEDFERDGMTITSVRSQRSDFLAHRAGSPHDDDDYGSRDGRSVGANSQERIVHWRRLS